MSNIVIRSEDDAFEWIQKYLNDEIPFDEISSVEYENWPQ